MILSVEDACVAACSQILDTRTLVRVVLSGRRRNMQTEFKRIDIRPVEIKGTVQLQRSHNDGRATTVKNLIPNPEAVLTLLRSGYANILVDHTGGSMTVRITKSGDAHVHYEKKELEQDLSHDKKLSLIHI